MKTKEVKLMIIENYIDWNYADEDECNELKREAYNYVEEDWVDEIKQSLPMVNSDINSDIAIIEALNDLLIDVHGYSLDFITLKRAKELTARMYRAVYKKQLKP